MANEFVVKNGLISPNVQLQGSTSGSVTIAAPAVAGTTSITLPSTAGTLVTTGDTGTVTNTMLAGSIANAKLVNSAVTVGSTSISLGASSTTLAGLTSVTSTSFVGALTGNASTATTLQTARTIALSGDVAGSVSFDGSANATITTTIQPDSVALGTDTTGNYMVNVSAGTGVTVSHTPAEGSTATVSIGQAVGTTDNVTFNNVTVNGTLTSDDITSASISVAGNATITGNLTVSGTTTTINSTTIAIADLNLELARNATTATQANGAGITVTGPATAATLTYSSTDDRWNLNKNLNITRVYGTATNVSNVHTAGSYLTGGTFDGSSAVTWAVDGTPSNTASKVVARDASGNFSASTITAALSGNASTASSWQNARTLSYTGDVTGSMSVDGSVNVSTALTLAASGVTAGTYNNVTVNSKGLVTSGSNVAYLTAESDTLATVTGRGASTSTKIDANGGIYAPKIGIASSNLADVTNGAPWYGVGASTSTGWYGNQQTVQLAGYYGLMLKTANTQVDFDMTGGTGVVNVSSGTLKTGSYARLGGGTSNPTGTTFSHTLAGVSTNRIVNFDGNGNGAPSVWWTSGSRAYGAIDAKDPGLTFWANNGTSWQQQFEINYGNVIVNTDIRSPIFYDSNNTTYYFDGTATTRVNTLRVFSNAAADWDAVQISSNGANGYIQGLGDETGIHIRSEYGNVFLADDRGATIITTGSIAASDAGTRGLIFDGNYTNGQYRHRFRKTDDGGGLPLYIDYCGPTANSFGAIARFGGGGSYNSFSVYGTGDASNDFRAPIFYDSNDTTYYLDPNSSGTSLYVAGSITSGNGGSDTGLRINHGNGAGDYGRIRFYQAGTNNQTIHVFPTTWQSGTLAAQSSGAINLSGANGVTFGAWNSVSGYIGNSGDLWTRSSIQAPVGIFTNDGSSRVLYLKGSGNIIQFQDADGTNRWENVGRNGQYYVYKGYGTGSGYKFQINDSGDVTINNGSSTTISSSKLYLTIATPSGVQAVNSAASMVIDNTGNNFIQFRNSADNGTYQGLLFSDNNQGGYVVFANAGAGDLLRLGGYGSISFDVGTDDSTSSVAIKTQRGYIDSSANLFAFGSMRSPIFYDYNDTNYYCDPNSTSRLNGITINDGNVQLYKTQTVDMSNTGVYSTSNYYPVIIGVPTYGAWIEIQNNLNSNVPSWATHGSGFTLNLRWWTSGSGWGTTEVKRRVEVYHERFTNSTICGGITQMGNSSTEVVWLRGGGTYYFRFSRDLSASAQSSTYTSNSQSVSPTSSAQNTVWNSGTGGHVSYNNSVFADARMDSPIFYDWNDTGYYCDPNSTSALSTVTVNGNITARNGNGTIVLGGNFHMDAYNGNDIYVNYYSARRFRTFYTSNAESFRTDTDGIVYAYNQFRTPIVYDNNDTAYYSDPASTSWMNTIKSSVFCGRDSNGYGMFKGYDNNNHFITVRGAVSGTNASLTVTGAHQTTFVEHMSPADSSSGWFFKDSYNGANFNYATIFRISASDSWVKNYLTGEGSLRAPIFYDSDNTGYYMDPSSSGNVQGNWEFSATSNSSTSYSEAAIELRESNKGGSGSYLPPRLSFHWGGVVASQIGIESDGRIRIMNNPGSGYENLIGNILYGSASVRAPIFYDSDDTGYYLDPNATPLSLKVSGNIELTARSASWAEGIRINVPSSSTWGGIRWTRGSAAGNWALGYTALDSSDDISFYSGTTTSIRVRLDHSANLWAYGSMRSPIFYDNDDTGYYADPNSTSVFNGLTINGTLNAYANAVKINRINFTNTSGSQASDPYCLRWRSETDGDTGSLSWLELQMNDDNNEEFRIYGYSCSGYGCGQISSNLYHRFYSNGDAWHAGNVTAYSDIRVKDNISIIDNAIDKVMQIRGVTFTRNDKADTDTRHAGVIAQEVEAVLPEVVDTDEFGMKSVAYGNMVGLLIEAIKEQQKQIEELKGIINEIRR